MSNKALQETEWEFQQEARSFWGVAGALVLSGKRTKQGMSIDIDLHHAAEVDLRNLINTMQGNVGINGELQVDGLNWSLVQFLGFEPTEPQFYDPEFGYVQFGTLKFQRILAGISTP